MMQLLNCFPLFIQVLFKFSILFQTSFGIIKSGAEFTCVQSRPGLEIDTAHFEITNLTLRVGNKLIFVNQETVGLTDMRFVVRNSLRNDYEVVEISSITNTYNNDGAPMDLNLLLEFSLSETGHSSLSYKTNTTEVKKFLKLKYIRYSEDCSTTRQFAVNAFKIYLLLIVVLCSVLLFYCIPSEYKTEGMVYNLQVQLIRFFEVIGAYELKSSQYCYNRSKFAYNGMKGVLVPVLGYTKLDCGSYDFYTDLKSGLRYAVVGNNIYIHSIQDGCLKGDISNVFESGDIKFKLEVLKNVFYANEYMGLPCVSKSHCLALPEIIGFIESGFGFEKVKKDEFFFGEEVDFHSTIINELCKFNKVLKWKLFEHNKLFFGEVNWETLAQICLNRLAFPYKPANCGNAKWKMYTSDCSQIMSSFGIQCKGVNSRKLTPHATFVINCKEEPKPNNQDWIIMKSKGEEISTSKDIVIEEDVSNDVEEDVPNENESKNFNIDLAEFKSCIKEIKELRDSTSVQVQELKDLRTMLQSPVYDNVPTCSEYILTTYKSAINKVRRKVKTGCVAANQLQISDKAIADWVTGTHVDDLYQNYLTVEKKVWLTKQVSKQEGELNIISSASPAYDLVFNLPIIKVLTKELGRLTELEGIDTTATSSNIEHDSNPEEKSLDLDRCEWEFKIKNSDLRDAINTCIKSNFEVRVGKDKRSSCVIRKVKAIKKSHQWRLDTINRLIASGRFYNCFKVFLINFYARGFFHRRKIKSTFGVKLNQLRISFCSHLFKNIKEKGEFRMIKEFILPRKKEKIKKDISGIPFNFTKEMAVQLAPKLNRTTVTNRKHLAFIIIKKVLLEGHQSEKGDSTTLELSSESIYTHIEKVMSASQI